MKVQIIICDDEKEIRELLKEKVQHIYPEAEIELCVTGKELLTRENEPDILFLDIQMPVMDGMKTARELRKKWEKTILIFVTAIEEYVFQAFDVRAFHYLVKPFTDKKFYEVLADAVKMLNDRTDLKASIEDEKYMMISSKGSHIKVLVKNITYAEVFNRKVMIHTQDEKIEYYGKLSELEDSLGDDFFRPHRAYLIHYKYVMKYDATSITMTNGTVLMAKANFPEFVRKYLKYNQRKGTEIH